MRKGLVATDPNLALYWIRTLDEALLLKTSGYRIIGGMFAIFASVALVLAAAGLFGVLAFHVGQRTREIGVRRALGADDGRILRLVVRVTGTQVLAGVVIGMVLLPLVGRGLQAILDNVNGYDPLLYALTVVSMLAVAVVATWVPTRRALRIDPAVALRYE
jgi:ABC-type antimicrobial peptide transport system permease subunit